MRKSSLMGNLKVCHSTPSTRDLLTTIQMATTKMP
jgi:hypothetical protein